MNVYIQTLVTFIIFNLISNAHTFTCLTDAVELLVLLSEFISFIIQFSVRMCIRGSNCFIKYWNMGNVFANVTNISIKALEIAYELLIDLFFFIVFIYFYLLFFILECHLFTQFSTLKLIFWFFFFFLVQHPTYDSASVILTLVAIFNHINCRLLILAHIHMVSMNPLRCMSTDWMKFMEIFFK